MDDNGATPSDTTPSDAGVDAPVDEWSVGDLLHVLEGRTVVLAEVGECGVVVCRVGGALFAVENRCSHAVTPLADGKLRGHRLICARHGAQFDVRDGSRQSPPAVTGIAAFDVDTSGGEAAVVIRRRR
jgi:3-phenylpropionate/trans-cinnamate dioxygenase ferredoxin component